MSRSQTEHDLSQHLQQAVGDVIKRHAEMAAIVLGPSEVSLMLIQCAVSVTMTAAATTAASCQEGKVEEVYDMTLSAIGQFAVSERERSLGKIRARLAAEVSA